MHGRHKRELQPKRENERDQLARILAGAQADLAAVKTRTWISQGHDAIESVASNGLARIRQVIFRDLAALVKSTSLHPGLRREERESVVLALELARVKLVELAELINRQERTIEHQNQSLLQADDNAQELARTQQMIAEITALRDQERGQDQAALQQLRDEIECMQGTAISQETYMNLQATHTELLRQIEALAASIPGSSGGGGSEMERWRAAIEALHQAGATLQTDLAQSRQALQAANLMIRGFEDSSSSAEEQFRGELRDALVVIDS